MVNKAFADPAILQDIVETAMSVWVAPKSLARAQLAEHPALKWAAGIYAKHRGKSAALAEETII